MMVQGRARRGFKCTGVNMDDLKVLDHREKVCDVDGRNYKHTKGINKISGRVEAR